MPRPKTRGEQRRADLITALRTLRDVSETLQRGDSGGGFFPDSRLLMMPKAWHAGCPPNCEVPFIGEDGLRRTRCRSTYAQLIDSLLVLRHVGPGNYWHLTQRYLESERLTRELVRFNGGQRSGWWHAVRAVEWSGDEMRVRYTVGRRLERNAEIRSHATDVRAPVQRQMGVQAGRPVWRTEPGAKLVLAGIERWDPAVNAKAVDAAVSFLLRLMPAHIALPREVLAAIAT